MILTMSDHSNNEPLNVLNCIDQVRSLTSTIRLLHKIFPSVLMHRKVCSLFFSDIWLS